jgi:HlyD family secretion protein
MLKTVGAWMRRHPIWSGIIGIAILLGSYMIFAPKKPTYEYVTADVDRGDVMRKVTASGKLRALNTIKVGAEVSGQITQVYVDFNSSVSAGQILAEIDPTRFRARVQQVEAQVAVARANLAQAEANVIRAQTEFAIQEREFGRKRNLAQSGFLSKSSLDGASSLYATAKASLRTTGAQVASARASISQTSAELTSAQLDLRRTTIIAPTSGVIINKLVEPGTTVAASFQTPNLFEIAADTTRMQVEASVDEADIGEVKDGQKVEFLVDAYPDVRFPALVRQIRKSATESQNVVSYLVILEVDNGEGKLLPGMTANVEIITGIKSNVMRVPTSALRFRPRLPDREKGNAQTVKASKPTPTLYVAGSDAYKPAARIVTIGLQGEDFTEIVKGVSVKDKVLVRSRSLAKPIEASDDEEGNSSDDDSAN